MAAKNRSAFAPISSTTTNCVAGIRRSAANTSSMVAMAGDEENRVGIRKSSGLAVPNQQLLSKSQDIRKLWTTTTRLPLGQLTNNIRVAPSLALSKQVQVHGREQRGPQKFPTSGFVIHVDADENVPPGCVDAEVPILEDRSAAQPPDPQDFGVRGRHPKADEDLTESPMVMDISPNSEQKKLDDDDDKENNVPCTVDSAQDKSTTVPVIEEDVSATLYSADIYAYLRRLELMYRPKAKYMLKQPDITNGMRSILVDWLVEVAEEYVLQPETLFLAVGYIDRFLSCMSVLRTKLQLVGAACMLVAAKFEEIYPPEVKEFVYITNDTYTRQQMLRMEQVILRVLAFGLSTPTMHYFVNRYCVMGRLDGVCRNLAMYFCELSLLEADPYLQFVPSIVAGSAVCLACHTLDLDPWNEHLREQSGYVVDDFKRCLPLLHKSYVSAPHYQQQSVRTKYTSKKFSEVANVNPPMNLPI